MCEAGLLHLTAYIDMDGLVLGAREVSHKLALIRRANQCSQFGLISRGEF